MNTLISSVSWPPSWRLLICLTALPLLYSCGVVLRTGNQGDKVEVIPGANYQLELLGIPPGHLPPPGSCRIWVPGKPPGQQLPPGNCTELEPRVPVGAWLLHRHVDNPDYIEIFVYHEQRPSVVVVIRYFEAATGRFLREARP